MIYPTWVCASQFAQTDERFGFVSIVTQDLKEAINRDVTLPDDYKMPASLRYISKSSKLRIAPQPFSTKEEVKLFNKLLLKGTQIHGKNEDAVNNYICISILPFVDGRTVTPKTPAYCRVCRKKVLRTVGYAKLQS